MSDSLNKSARDGQNADTKKQTNRLELWLSKAQERELDADRRAKIIRAGAALSRLFDSKSEPKRADYWALMAVLKRRSTRAERFAANQAPGVLVDLDTIPSKEWLTTQMRCRLGASLWCEWQEAETRELEAAKAEREFKLPENQDYFGRADIKRWAKINNLGKGDANINKHLRIKFPDFAEEKELTRECFVEFLRVLRNVERDQKAP